MMRFITPLILTAAGLGLFLIFTNPAYNEAQGLSATKASYDQALDNSLELQKVRDILADKYKNLSPDSLERLKRMLPDAVGNIKLILDIQGIADRYGMPLREVKYDVLSKSQTQPASITAATTPEAAAAARRDYGSFDLEFSTDGTYGNFLSFLGDVEKSLRIVDIGGITFSSTESAPGSGIYKYQFKIKTYWLKG
jgi:hypothetical protein